MVYVKALGYSLLMSLPIGGFLCGALIAVLAIGANVLELLLELATQKELDYWSFNEDDFGPLWIACYVILVPITFRQFVVESREEVKTRKVESR